MNSGGPSRRTVLKWLGAGAATVTLGNGVSATLWQEGPQRLPDFTGPGPNPYWNSVGSYVVYPQKAPLILLTDRPVQLETPRHNFLSAFTPNAAFYVRWHLDEIPTTVDLSEWRLSVQGNVEKPQRYAYADLVGRYKPVSVAAVNQCSGNSRSRFQPRVPGGQWGNGAMGNALWTGVRLKELLDAAGVKKGAVEVQFEGMDRGKGPEGFGSHKYLKSLLLTHPVIDECVIALQMNGEPLPMLNGFPARLVVPGYFATYWVKALTHIRVLDSPDENFWMKTAYRVPNTPRGNTTPGEMKAGKVKTLPMGRMPVRSFLITPDGSSKIPAGLPVALTGIAFSGHDRVVKVEVSTDGGQVWRDARLAEDYGPFAFRAWDFMWLPERPGRHVLAVRATDGQGNIQPDDPVWNAGGYLWDRIERQEVVVGSAS
jgi:DMSO/TMAO reductase YedYZ molybdopterin-dependent catalytic subunit